jgi:hypothetical protein
MYNLLVLGLVPGTNIQITFKVWLDVIGLGIVGFLAYNMYRNNEAAQAFKRVPLHANQLHRRLA